MSQPKSNQSGDGWVELRVHGVSGTTPEALLDRHDVHQVGGDAIAGFYCPTIEEQRVDAAPNPLAAKQERAPMLEGYNWGGLTSGSAGRAFWLVLLPFTLANLVPRARPLSSSAMGVWLIWYFSRVLALTLTALFVLAAAGIGQDLIGWQCARTPSCQKASPHWIFGRMYGIWDGTVHTNGLPDQQILAIGTLIPALVLFAIWFVSGRTINRYEMVAPHATNGPSPTTAPDDVNALEVNLGSLSMWMNQAQVRRLRALHVQIGIAAIDWTLSGALRNPWPSSLIPVAMTAYALVCLGIPAFVGRNECPVLQWLSWFWWVPLIGIGGWQILGLFIRSNLLKSVPLQLDSMNATERTAGLPRYGSTLVVIFLIAILTLLFVCLVDLWLSVDAGLTLAAPGVTPMAQRVGALGLTSSVFAVFAVLLAAVFSSGAYVFSAAWLSTGSVKPALTEVVSTANLFELPEAARDAGYAYFLAVGFAVLWLVVVGLWCAWCYKPFHWLGEVPLGQLDDAVELDYPGLAATDRDRRRAIRRDIFVARLIDHAPVIVAPLAVAGFLLGMVYGTLLLIRHFLDHHWMNGLAKHLMPTARMPGPHLMSFRFWSTEQLGALGSYLAVATVLGLVSLGALAFRVQATRKTVGILWDVASFWPRAAHPLAAPCYAERTVPDLVTRIAYHLPANSSEDDRRLVLAAHSQGTVISAAALFHLHTCWTADPTRLHGVKLLTFGNVMRRLYGRYFPVYFGPAQITTLKDDVLTTSGKKIPRWINLWRYTDYLGGRIDSGPPPDLATPAAVYMPPPPAAPFTAPGPPPTLPNPGEWEQHRPDPPYFAIRPGETTYSAAHRHSDFWSDESGYFQAAVKELLLDRP